MKTAKEVQTEAKKAFRKAIREKLFPFLESHGFRKIDNADKNLWVDWHRPRTDGSYDVLAIAFCRRGKPGFTVGVAKVPKEGVTSIFGENIPADRATAFSTNNRVRLFPNRAGFLSYLTRSFLNHAPYQMRLPETEGQLQSAALDTIGQFIKDYDQLETWWNTGALGASMKQFQTAFRPKASAMVTRS